ncbi:hypothetical protein CHLNCDRAFT_138399 [Chlorella variabilis]|uniref:ATP-dependent DNA ligase family profile domain-containing protein n=1 Tax=Chlorella variabilis TaxID=554065 RepID=E1ZMY9_CHLVA|nr:hypothetical protein CHLNCDRAFT_144011 [Chlorella variabilis]XP_005844877.1 hypothetical protein CHLNCDRAFT_138394 [Chlorella variabilis]XP_005844880.1 hypothetical protein CHLNCDRAFT_138399 [Chlorella variabilis]EFN50659.1 hypothetical protein CHLNCDRAFT_144011 [Chlorella variabilis]EFN52775.1 hypothetical protein CHLNCDRAFT_138394 [Chlorella variabilis]EFN52778.1 hypothetical protein CHLNCDRAFT_138399 [Chlorella variabilis]|eukprot:XP_005842776.1 hypothetical protein CHLNCDRAFT_144011 [Chlorella variabilis]
MHRQKICSTAADVQDALMAVMKRHEEGIMIKSLDSKWVPGDRSGHWCKLKPDYLHKAS